MKKRFLFLVLALMLCLSVGATALAATRTARGNCAIIPGAMYLFPVILIQDRQKIGSELR